MSAGEVLEIALLSLRVGLVATALILVPGVAAGWLFARRRFRGRALLQALVWLPMVLPPVAVGLLLLFALARGSWLGDALGRALGRPVLLSWWAAALAAAVMSFPLVVLGARAGFESVPRRLEEVAATLGAGRLRVFTSVTLPLAFPGILHGTLFAFARGLGEFGATVVVAGVVPGETETLALAIYARIEDFRDGEALVLALVALALAFAATALAEIFLGRSRAR